MGLFFIINDNTVVTKSLNNIATGLTNISFGKLDIVSFLFFTTFVNWYKNGVGYCTVKLFLFLAIIEDFVGE